MGQQANCCLILLTFVCSLMYSLKRVTITNITKSQMTLPNEEKTLRRRKEGRDR